MKKALIMFANSFPYTISEPFLEIEQKLYREYFDKVLMVTNSPKGQMPTREIDRETIDLIDDVTLSKDALSILSALPWVLTDRRVYREIFELFSTHRMNVRNLYSMLTVSFCANHRAKQAYSWIKQNREYHIAAIYGTWLYVPAYAAIRLNDKLNGKYLTVSRAHGFDVYLERHKDNYIPFHKQLYQELDCIAAISQDGKRYLEEAYGDMNKVQVYHLGAYDRGMVNPCEVRDVFHIVSCSRVIPLKRLELIVEALSQIKNKRIHWIHFGDGERMEALRKAVSVLPENITVELPGRVSNQAVYDYYQNQPVHAFVNVSETEGIPVAIMEAMSFGIPAIATAVGGTPEVLDDLVTGLLLPENLEAKALAESLYRVIDMPSDEYLQLRQNARNKFKQEFSAVPNYKRLLGDLLKGK